MNTLYCCYLTCDQTKHDALVVRILDDETKDKRPEELALKIAEITGCGKEVYASFQNGFVLGFARGQPLTWNDLWDSKKAKYVQCIIQS